MNRHVNSISGRLSLRAPQRESLEILARICDIVPLEKGQDLEAALEVIRSEFPSVDDFERDFPSLCFALATGVGKTRLMGAFIAYLHQAKGMRHFFVLAPNLTIYNKLIADFTPGTEKYVLQGLAEFATNPPEIITGDNYESGRGVRATDLFGHAAGVHINIFNISKLNTEVRGGKAPRIKRLHEYIGESYFDYLAGLDDLVLLMDESHRYRASAGIRAINELKPILGLELTATPQVETGGRAEPFKNVIYSYPLSNALRDGFVKEPAVATRENFDVTAYTEAQLERLKLEDGIRVHEAVKVDLETFARENDLPIVKPFMLVVAQDTAHAEELVRTMEDDTFYDGRYRDRVITVHSNQRGEEKDETVQQLMSVEDAKNPTEIVVHVNMLKEGWDVRNLYTIVPLRAANSRTLVEQSIGRGLRLPYGKRVGVTAVDRLTIVAHDRFQEIVDAANNPNSVIRTGVVIGRDIAVERKQTVVVQPKLEEEIVQATIALPGVDGARPAQPLFRTPAEQEIARATIEAIQSYTYLPRSADLQKPEVRERLVAQVTATLKPEQTELDGVAEAPDVAAIVEKAAELFVERTIDIPRIVVLPTGDVTSGFRDFDLDTSGIRVQPVAMDILIQHLRTHQRERLTGNGRGDLEPRLENYLVRALIDFDDISYDDHADLLYKLAGQMVAHLRSYLPDEDAVRNVLQYHGRRLAEAIHAQMQAHHWERASEYETRVNAGFTTLRSAVFSAPAGEPPRPFRDVVEERQYIRGMRFGGFRKCLYPEQKFDSDTERRFAVILEDEEDVVKWFKPAKDQFRIYYGRDQAYEPDFVVETEDAKYLVEPKRASEIDDPDVQAKARAAVAWCERASEHELAHGGKPWAYVLVPHHAVRDDRTLAGLVAAYAVESATSAI